MLFIGSWNETRDFYLGKCNFTTDSLHQSLTEDVNQEVLEIYGDSLDLISNSSILGGGLTFASAVRCAV